jgi:hypothetical protein
VKIAYLAIFILAVISVGCASLSTERFVSVETTSGSITAAAAVDLFHSVVRTLGLVERNPTHDPRTPYFFEYSAETAEMRFHLMVDGSDIEFISTVYGKQEDLVRAERAANIIESALDKLGAKYKVRKGRNPMFWGS